MKPTLSRDLGTGPLRPFGSAHKRAAPSIPIIVERPIRPAFGGLSGRCPTCGSRYFGCGCQDDEA